MTILLAHTTLASLLRCWGSCIIVLWEWDTSPTVTRIQDQWQRAHTVLVIIGTEWPDLLVQVPLAFSAQPTRLNDSWQLIRVWTPRLFQQADLNFSRIAQLPDED